MISTQKQPHELTRPSVGLPQVTIVEGDGIGPEIMEATLQILEASGANFQMSHVVMGEQLYLSGHTSGISSESWQTIRQSDAILKAPITTPMGSGYKSLNVTLRKSLGLFANVRPSKSFYPFVNTHFPNADLVIIRENEEDLYAGIEHQQTEQVVQCLKLITRPGCERVVRYAFEYARSHGRSRVTCMVKDNIMKHTDGLFRTVFEEIGSQYPELERQVEIIDIGAARLATQPERYDVIVTLNLYGDILSDIAAESTGSVGMAGSANIGDHAAMFEAIHGSAPDITGQGIANPSGLLQASVAMMVHLGQPGVATLVNNAWLKTIEDGLHTPDIYNANYSTRKVGTAEFTQAVIDRMGEKPKKLSAVEYHHVPAVKPLTAPTTSRKQEKHLVGTDVFIDWKGSDPDQLGTQLAALGTPKLRLKMITNRGVKVYPEGIPETFLTDHWRCRFVAQEAHPHLNGADVIDLLQEVNRGGLEVIKTENLYTLNGDRAYSLGQGE